MNYTDVKDAELVQSSLSGDKKALETLLTRHQPFIYNVAWKMVLSPVDAGDITQDILIKVITNLSAFQGKSQFRTWLYRIVVNHILNMKKRQLEQIVTTFENYFDGLEQMPDYDLSDVEKSDLKETIEEVKISCSAGMLLCLDREQRMILVLGDIYEINHNLGAEIFNITPENFRQKLSRARRDLYNWMNNKCSLVNKANPCQCPKKTKAFIEQGYVDPKALKFNSNYKKKLNEVLNKDLSEECNTIEDLHQRLFQSHPFKEPVSSKEVFDEIVNNKLVKEIYGF